MNGNGGESKEKTDVRSAMIAELRKAPATLIVALIAGIAIYLSFRATETMGRSLQQELGGVGAALRENQKENADVIRELTRVLEGNTKVLERLERGIYTIEKR